MDLTGLGKTVTSTTIAINQPNVKKILVISPIKNKLSWINTLNQTDLNYTICSGQKISNDVDFDLIIVDEAHNYRNCSAASYKKLWLTIRSQNTIPPVILLSATPFQNTFDEFLNTISLIPFKTNTFAYLLLGNYISNINESLKVIKNIKRKGDNITDLSFQDIGRVVESEGLINANIELFTKHLGEFCIRNTREYIAATYPNDMATISMFPTIIKNDKTKYQTNEIFSNLISSVHRMIGNEDLLPLAKYNMQKYVKTNDNYIGMNGIMRSFLLKRLDSSTNAFIETLDKMITKINDILSQNTGDEFSNIKIEDTEYCVPIVFFDDCQKDLASLTELLSKAKSAMSNDKELELLKIINDGSGKTVVFTEYKATLNTICDFLKANNVSYISFDGSSDEKLLDVISTEFDANGDKRTNKFQVLVCTDILAEGVNLHIANKLVHYDSKWNPQKTTQRNGRVDRIFAKKVENHIVNIYTFAIDKFIDSIIKFESKTDNKLEMADKVLNFDWVNYKPNINTKYEIGKKYVVDNNTSRYSRIGFKLNSGYDLVLYSDDISLMLGRNSLQETHDAVDLNNQKIITEGLLGNKTKEGGKAEVSFYDTYGKRDRFFYKEYINKYLEIEIPQLELIAITNSHINKSMFTIIGKDLVLNKDKSENINVYRKVLENIVKLNGQDTVKYYQVLGTNVYMDNH